MKAERTPVELDSAFKVVHIDVYQELHGMAPSMTPHA
jgi:hypothetical protein